MRVDLENLIIEGSRQLREWEQLQEEIPSLDMALKFTDRPGHELAEYQPERGRMAGCFVRQSEKLDPPDRRATKMNDLEIRRVVYGLLQAGLVEIIRPEGSPLPSPAPHSSPRKDKDEQKSLVNRLINRIRSL